LGLESEKGGAYSLTRIAKKTSRGGVCFSGGVPGERLSEELAIGNGQSTPGKGGGILVPMLDNRKKADIPETPKRDANGFKGTSS